MPAQATFQRFRNGRADEVCTAVFRPRLCVATTPILNVISRCAGIVANDFPIAVLIYTPLELPRNSRTRAMFTLNARM